jgi:hypothetical protein
VNPAIARAVAGLLGSTAGALWLLCMYMVVRSGFSANSGIDPHGYGLMFGTVVGVIAGGLFAVVLPAAFPASRRRSVARACIVGIVLPMALLYVALFLR